MSKFRPLVMGLALVLTWTVAPLEAQRIVKTGPEGFNPVVNYGLDNFAYSPNIRKFVDSLPGLGLPGCSIAIPAGSAGSCNQNNLGQYIPVADKSNNSLYPDADFYSLGIKQYSVKMHSDLPPTLLRGYYQVQGSGPGQSLSGGVSQYLGPLILARSYDPNKPVNDSVTGNGAAVRILFQNNLPLTASGGNLFLPVDPTLMGAGMGPNGTANYTQNRANIHLHGGATPWISDGTPHQWITPAGEAFPGETTTAPYQKGASFQNVPDMIGAGKSIAAPSAGDGLGTLYWTNQQSQRLMFFHDHSYGITRLNVYGGMAAGYVLTDQVEDDMIKGTNVSGAFTTPKSVLPNLPLPYTYGIPLVIQDRTFVNDASTPIVAATTTTPTAKTSVVDPLWATYMGPTATGGHLWFPHEYMPNEDIYDASGALAWGRWDYGPWLNPPLVPLNNTLPSPSHVPETFADTMIVNGTAYPTFTVQPKAYRFRVLSAGNDRSLNLQFYVAADKTTPTTPGTTGTVLCNTSTAITANCTEVKMVPATNYPATPMCSATAVVSPVTGLPTGCTPTTWPIDGRNGGVPDPLTAGPQIYQIGNEGGILPQVAPIPSQPMNFEYSRRVPVMLNATSQALLLMPAERADIVVDFSAFAGQTLILYNDAAAPFPLYDERNDLYTGNPDWTAIGGAPSIPAGYGPNTRTVMQFVVAAGTPVPLDVAALNAALPQAYKATQAPPIVPQVAYNAAFGTTNTDNFVTNIDGTVNLTGKPQGVSSVMAIVPGSGFVVAPTVSFVPKDGNGSGALATACLNGVGAITVTVAGAGYTTAPAITFANPAGVTGSGVAAIGSVTGGGLGAIAVSSPGCSYTGNPTITIAVPPCTINTTTCIRATATANVTLGAVGSITVSAPGSGYTKAPTVFVTPAAGDPGKGATADAMLVGDTVIGMKNITEGFEPWYGRMNIQLGTTAVPLDPFSPAPQVPGIAMYIDPPSDFWNDGQVQVFRVAHLGVDSHIIHFHLANLQVINRVDFTNTMFPPLANEVGWKESIRTNPFTDLILAVKPVSQWLPFQIPQSNRLMDVSAPAGSTLNYIQPAPVAGLPNPTGISNVMTNYGWEYVWHCHLLGHEENDMMRPIVFNVPVPVAPISLTATQPTVGSGSVTLSWTGGVDTNARTYRIQRSTTNTFVTFTTFLVNGFPPATTFVDTTASGTDFYRVRAENGAGISLFSNIATLSVTSKATMVTPVPSSALTGSSVAFTWTAGTGVTQTGIFVGTTLGGTDIFNQAPQTATTTTVANMPTNGSTAYVRLWSLIGISWQYVDYTYTTAQAQAVMLTPVPASTLAGASVTFTWTPGTGVTQSGVFVGTTLGGTDIFNQAPQTLKTATVTNMPTNGSTVYVRLWSLIGTAWLSKDYTYTAAQAQAVMLTPVPASTLAGTSATFTWTPGTGVTQSGVFVGTTLGGSDIYAQAPQAGTTATITNLPTNGSTVYVRLWSLLGTAWLSKDYTYTATLQAKAAMLSPVSPSTFLAGPVTFNWTAGTGVTQTGVFVGTTLGGSDIFYQAPQTGTTATVSTLPQTIPGPTVYVRLWSLIGTAWLSNDYTYTAF